VGPLNEKKTFRDAAMYCQRFIAGKGTFGMLYLHRLRPVEDYVGAELAKKPVEGCGSGFRKSTSEKGWDQEILVGN